MANRKFSFFGVAFSFLFLLNNNANAHYDAIDGPVLTAAIKAVETGIVNFVLIWGNKEYENEIRNSCQKTLEVRKLAPKAKKLADTYFFETLVSLTEKAKASLIPV